MYKFNKYIISLFILLLLIGNCALSAKDASGAAFLKIGVGARAIGMGEAFVAVSDDANALYWNPAGLSQIKKRELTAMYNQWFADIQHLYAGYVSPSSIIKEDNFGFSLNYLNYRSITKTFETSAGLYGGEDGTYSAYDLAGAVAYSRRITNSLFTGVNLKYIQLKNESESANGIGFDIGFLINVLENLQQNTRVGLVIQNIGLKMKFIDDPFSLPTTVKAGIAHDITEDITSALDISQRDLSLGGEWWVTDSLAIRSGFNIKFKSNKLGSGLRLGTGFGNELFRLDYAYVLYGDLGNTHRISLTTRFDLPAPAPTQTAAKKTPPVYPDPVRPEQKSNEVSVVEDSMPFQSPPVSEPVKIKTGIIKQDSRRQILLTINNGAREPINTKVFWLNHSGGLTMEAIAVNYDPAIEPKKYYAACAYKYLNSAQNYFEELGLAPTFAQVALINISAEKDTPEDTSYVSGNTVIVPNAEKMTEEIIIHKYTHILLHSICGNPPSDNKEADGLDEGFAIYFTGSHSENSIFNISDADKTINEFHTYDPNGDTGNAIMSWASALWALREKLGPDTADTLISNSISKITGYSFENAIDALLFSDKELLSGKNEYLILDIMQGHGF